MGIHHFGDERKIMSFKNVIISSGHGKYVRGASGILDEVDEARHVVDRVAEELRGRDVQVSVFHDDVSQTQSENLERIVGFHNSKTRQLDISVHFNAYVETTKPMGCEVLYQSQSTLAGEMSLAISKAAKLKNRGPKKRTDLYFLNETDMPAILIEVAFVDSQADATLYGEYFEAICGAIAETLKDKEEEEPLEPSDAPLLVLSGKCSQFGGPDDTGVAPDEGLAFIYEIDTAPHLFLPYQPAETTGLARRLNPHIHYVACRWDYNITPPDILLSKPALVRVPDGIALTAFPADWGPHPDTGRIADLSPGLMEDLGLQTDDEVEVIFPA
jgi:N-acetylmuramoyl-L-alanine amidase